MRAALALAALALVAAGCRRPAPTARTETEARARLASSGIAFTEEELVRRAGAGEVDIVDALLAAGIDPDALGGRALASATANGELDVVRRLLDGGADPDLAGGSFGQTPLVSALLRGHPRVVELLLERGADPDAPSRGGAVALLFANDAATARRLLEAGAAPDARDAAGATALMGAVVVGDLEVVDLLLQHGADPNAADSEGRTALLRAKVFRFGQIEERLLAGGAAPLRVPRVRFERLEAYSGRYGEPGAIAFQVIHDRGRLIMIEQGSNGLLYEKELLPLDERTFYRRGDPGLVLYRFELDSDGRVTGLSRPVGPGRQAAPRLD